MLRVLSCLIYRIIINYVCIDYLGYEKRTLSDLCLGRGGSYKYFIKKYDNILGFGIPDLLMHLLSFHAFLKKNDSVVILVFINRIFVYYFNNGFIILILMKKI